MSIFKLLGIGIIAVVFTVLLKKYRPEIAILIPVIAYPVMFALIIPYLETVLNMFDDIAEQVGIDTQYISIVIKIMGVAYITQFGAELCSDAGEKSIAGKIEFGGKIIIAAMSMPVVYRLLGLVSSIINF